MSIEWNTILNSAIAFVVLIALKALLDLRLVQMFVRYFFWIPLRNYFREKPVQISGQWEQIWGGANSCNFQSETERHGHPDINQLGSYCYGEFISKNVTYVVFGRVVGEYFVGDWYDKKDPRGYFGAFQLEIRDSQNMIGRWVGHSKTIHEVRSDIWEWKKVS